MRRAQEGHLSPAPEQALCQGQVGTADGHRACSASKSEEQLLQGGLALQASPQQMAGAVAAFMVTLNEKLSLKEDTVYVPPTADHIFLYKCDNDMISHSISKKMVMTLKSTTAEEVLISSIICS